jgi:anti-anti-sigma regulatory factor
MNSNLYERKSFLEGNWMSTNAEELFSKSYSGQNLILKVNLHRASANEASSLKKYLAKNPIQNNKKLIIDFGSCLFIDSTFLSTIISYRNNNNLEIKLVVPNRKQLTLFKITKLDSLFKIYLSLDQALA